MKTTHSTHQALSRPVLYRSNSDAKPKLDLEQLLEHFREHRELPCGDIDRFKGDKAALSFVRSNRENFENVREADQSARDEWDQEEGLVYVPQAGGMFDNIAVPFELEAAITGDTDDGSMRAVKVMKRGTPEEYRAYEEVIFDGRTLTTLSITGIDGGLPRAEVRSVKLGLFGGAKEATSQIASSSDFQTLEVNRILAESDGLNEIQTRLLTQLAKPDRPDQDFDPLQAADLIMKDEIQEQQAQRLGTAIASGDMEPFLELKRLQELEQEVQELAQGTPAEDESWLTFDTEGLDFGSQFLRFSE